MLQSPENQLAYLGFQLVTPSEVLRPYIRSFWYIRPKAPLPAYHEEYMHPTGGYGIGFNLGGKVQLDGQDVDDPVFLDGSNTVSRKMGFSGQNELIGIRFVEAGAYPFLGLPLSELQNGQAVLDAVKDKSLIELHSKLQESPSLADRIRLLEEWLIGRLSLGIEQHPLVPASVRMIREKGQALPIPQIAQELAVGQRQLERLFRSQVGMTPKQYVQLLRVESARQILRRGEETTTTTIGADLGYYDQSHFIREFSAVVGMTPYAYLKRKQKD